MSNFMGFLATNSRKNRPISQESSGQTSPKSNWVIGKKRPNRGHHLLFQQKYAPEMNQWQSL